jgi:IclR family acetate operon transcriptional repressor
MAFLPQDQVAEILRTGMPKYTEQTLQTPEDLFSDLSKIRQQGFAISEQEYESDINAIAAPIINADGCPIAVIAIVGPSFRLPYERMLMLGDFIRETTEAIAHEVGLAALHVIIPKTASHCTDG